MFENLQQLDTDLFLSLNGWDSAWLDNFMWYFSGKWIWIIFYVAILSAITLKYGWKRTLGIVLVIALIITVSDQLCGHVVRNAIGRLRPSNLDNPISPLVHIVNGYRGGSFGFPSCHAANSFGLAVFIALLFKKRSIAIAMLAWAVVTAWSRIVLGVHYPGDLLVGATVGSLTAFAAYYSARAIYRRRTHQTAVTDSPMATGIILTTLACIVIGMAITAAL